VFFCAGVLAAFSQFLAPRLARRIGLVRTMVFTHLPANGFLIIAALVPQPLVAIGFLLLRSLLSQMDVPARQTLVMAVVLPEEPAAAASVTNVPRSLAAAATPVLAGWLLANGSLAAPLVLAGSAKAAYDLLLLWRFRSAVVEHDRTP
jgi:predicted MFS family arabinose efflux permease